LNPIRLPDHRPENAEELRKHISGNTWSYR
jgi:hypothetical protein